MGDESTATLVIACAADGRYALPLSVMLRSLEMHLDAGRRVEAYVIDDGVQPAEKDKVAASLSGQVRLHWVQAAASPFAGLPTWGRMPLTTYQRLTMGEWLPADVSKALWLDCDLLMLRDVAPLWDTDLAGRPVMAVRDPRVPLVSSRFGVAAYRDLGLDSAARYFNAGVMLIDVARWRDDDLAGRAIHYLTTYRDRVYFWDQEALNAVLSNRWGELDKRWNWQPSAIWNGKETLETAWIVHYTGNFKPWSCDGVGPHHALYRRYIDETAWSGWRPPRSWWARILTAYQGSRWRRWLYPAEEWSTEIVRALTRQYDRKEEK